MFRLEFNGRLWKAEHKLADALRLSSLIFVVWGETARLVKVEG